MFLKIYLYSPLIVKRLVYICQSCCLQFISGLVQPMSEVDSREIEETTMN